MSNRLERFRAHYVAVVELAGSIDVKGETADAATNVAEHACLADVKNWRQFAHQMRLVVLVPQYRRNRR